MDVSGNPREGDYKFMGIVVGSQEIFDRIMKNFNSDPRHDTRYKTNTNRRFFISKLKLKNKEVVALAVTINRDDIINKVRGQLRIKQKGVSSGKIYKAYNYLVWNRSRDRIQEFIVDHHLELCDVIFQCDRDCRMFAKENGLHNADPGNAHFVADLIAWARNNGINIPGMVTIDVTDRLVEALKKSVLN
ncbi:hypothetical protein CENSYa_1465 [Cenarchaeum symbiosum A]|uniref:Uncharacterized protein n=1 Tax=Cenarchaeum symbiosum (strain A) TaxID=414004 RepID=A0RXM0_CENSY|nr:hypothetical protein CENSYa_1465 [Cenarchaeum symbiosum A]